MDNEQLQLISFSELLPYVTTRVPTADDLLIEQSARSAVNIFMQDTMLFKERTYIFGQCGVNAYILEIPDDLVMLDIEGSGVQFNGRPVRNAVRDGQYDVIFIANPVVGGCYEINYTYKLKPNACGFPKEIYDQWLEPVVDRTIIGMFTGTPESPVTVASYQIAKMNYENALAEIAGRKLHNFSNGRPKLRLRSHRRFF